MTEHRHVTVTTDDLDSIDAALAWVVTTLDREFTGADMPKITIEQIMREPLDLDAIRERVARINEGVDAGEVSLSPDSPARYAVLLVRLTDRDVPALLARITELEAEVAQLDREQAATDRRYMEAQTQRDQARAELAEARAAALPEGGEWSVRRGWMNGDKFQTYTSSAEGFLPATGPTHRQRIWTSPAESVTETEPAP